MTKRDTINIQVGCLAQLLCVLFIGLKLTNYIDWSWWWVLSPLWLPLAIVLAICAVSSLVMIICGKA